MVAYATQADVYAYGLPRGALGNPGRIVDSFPAATGVCTLSEHGFATGDAVTFRITQGGVIPSPLVAGATYYVLYLDDSTFQVSSAPGGSPVVLTSDAVEVIVTANLPFAQLLEYYSRFVDGFLPAEMVPLATPYPVTVIGVVATLVARRIQLLSGMTSVSMQDEEIGAKAQLERWTAGLPVRDRATAQVQTNLAVVQARRDEFVGGPFWRGARGW